MKFRERYSVVPQNAGEAVAVLKNITLAPSFDFSDRALFSLTTGSFGAGQITGNFQDMSNPLA